MGRTEKSQGLAPPAIRKDKRAKQARTIVKKVVPGILASNVRARKGVEASELVVDPGPVGVGAGDSVTAVVVGADKAKEKDEEVYRKRRGQGRRKMRLNGGGDVVEDGEAPKKGKRGKGGELDVHKLALDAAAQPSPATTITAAPQERRTRIIITDTLTAAQLLVPRSNKSSKLPQNPCILNMASPLRPGGGILAGATSQEEFLCARTTLLPALKEEFYRLPERGGIWTPDVLVFRRAGGLGVGANEIPVSERYYVDVVSAGMLRFPDLEGEEDEIKRLSGKDRRAVETKMRAVLRIAAARGVRRIVLGAWGCGAYGNPLGDIAGAWRRVLDGEAAAGGRNGKNAETWHLLTDVVFAISSPKMARDFASAYGDGIEVEAGPGSVDSEGEDEEDAEAEELRGRIRDLQDQIGMVWNLDLKARLGVVLEGLQAQLRDRESGTGDVDNGDEAEDPSDYDEESDEDIVESDSGSNS